MSLMMKVCFLFISSYNHISHQYHFFPAVLQIPSNSPAGDYKFRVDGGLSNSRTSIFSKETQLQFSSRSLTIVIQTNKGMYNFKDIGMLPLFFSTSDYISCCVVNAKMHFLIGSPRPNNYADHRTKAVSRSGRHICYCMSCFYSALLVLKLISDVE